jgi:hypothetical protein
LQGIKWICKHLPNRRNNAVISILHEPEIPVMELASLERLMPILEEQEQGIPLLPLSAPSVVTLQQDVFVEIAL